MHGFEVLEHALPVQTHVTFLRRSIGGAAVQVRYKSAAGGWPAVRPHLHAYKHPYLNWAAFASQNQGRKLHCGRGGATLSTQAAVGWG